MTSLAGDATMLDVLQGFVHELRVAGLPVSMTENLDAMRALEYVPIDNRETFKAALGATLVKHEGHAKVFETVFEVYFSMFSPGVDQGEATGEATGQDADFEQLRQSMEGAGAMGNVSNEELAKMLLDALMNMDREQLRFLAAAAVARYAGMEPGRPVGGAYYLYRTLRQLDAEGLVGKMMAQAQQDEQVGDGAFDERLAQEDFEGRLKVLKELIEAEIRRRLVADRGVEAMARTLRKPLPEDVDFMHASARGDAAAAARDLPADARAGCETRAAPPPPAPRHPRLPPDHSPLDGVRRHPGRAEVQTAETVEAGDHGRRRHQRLGRVLRALHVAVRLRNAERVLEGAVVGVHRRRRRGDPLLRRGRRHR